MYRERYPQIELRLIEHGSNQLEKHLRAGDIKIAGILKSQAHDLEWELIRREPMVALLVPGHPLSHCISQADRPEHPSLHSLRSGVPPARHDPRCLSQGRFRTDRGGHQ
jgi:DNA-binding transcriptional LysR family regulator